MRVALKAAGSMAAATEGFLVQTRAASVAAGLLALATGLREPDQNNLSFFQGWAEGGFKYILFACGSAFW